MLADATERTSRARCAEGAHNRVSAEKQLLSLDKVVRSRCRSFRRKRFSSGCSSRSPASRSPCRCLKWETFILTGAQISVIQEKLSSTIEALAFPVQTMKLVILDLTPNLLKRFQIT